MIDSYGRKIHYARISVTDLCNLRCKYCMPEEGIEKKDCQEILRIEDYITIAKALVDLGVDKIRLTGGEPLIRKGIITLVKEIGSLKGLKDFAITTNGVLLSRYAEELKKAGMKRVNISIDTLDKKKYYEITRGGNLDQVLEGLHKAVEVNFDKVKVNVVLIKGFNDDEIEDFVDITKKYPIDVRFIELMPFASQHEFAYGRYLPGIEVLKCCKELTPLKKDDLSAPAHYYRIPGAKGKVGLIEPVSHKFCSHCNRLRITADGHILNCLHSRQEIDLRGALNDIEALKALILKSVKDKPITHRLEDGDLMERDMGRIGG